MRPPENIEVYDNAISTYWFDEDDILYSVSKKSPPQSLEEIKKYIENVKQVLNGKKVCAIADITYSNESTRDIRDYAAVEFPKFIKAIAIISGSPLGKMLANIFFSIKPQPYPFKIVNNEKEAKEWLKQYL